MTEQEAMKDIYKQVREEIRNEYGVRIIELEEECRELALQRDKLAGLLSDACDALNTRHSHQSDECYVNRDTTGHCGACAVMTNIDAALAGLDKP